MNGPAHRSHYSDSKGPLGAGKPTAELWGVSQRDRRAPRGRGEKARLTRAFRRAARAAGKPLKAYAREIVDAYKGKPQ